MALTSYQIADHQLTCNLLRDADPLLCSHPKVITRSMPTEFFQDYNRAEREYADAWMQNFASDHTDSATYFYEADTDVQDEDETESGYSDHSSPLPEVSVELIIDEAEDENEMQKTYKRKKQTKRVKPKPVPAIKEQWDESIFEPIVNKQGDCRWNKPKLSFTSLIALSINSLDTKDGVSVQSIYAHIMDRFPHFEKTLVLNWKNSIRHNLSHSGVFCKSKFHRTAKKGYNWKVKPGSIRKINKEVKKYVFTEVRQIKHIMRSSGKSVVRCSLVSDQLI